MFILLRVRKSIFRTISILMSANKNISLKNLAFLSLSSTWKLARTIPNILRVEPSIFWGLMLFWWTQRPSFDTYASIIILILLLKLIRACISFVSFQKQSKKWIYNTLVRIFFFLFTSVTSVELAKTNASFLEVPSNCLHNGLISDNDSTWLD